MITNLFAVRVVTPLRNCAQTSDVKAHVPTWPVLTPSWLYSVAILASVALLDLRCRPNAGDDASST